MNNQQTRQLVSAAILGRARGAVQPAGDPTRAFVGGVVVRVDGPTVLGATREGDVVVNGAYARVWKGGVVPLTDCRPGDVFYARGTATASGTLLASHLWLNIVNIVGVVEAASDVSWRIRHTHLGIRQLNTVSQVSVNPATERFAKRGTNGQPRRGDYVQVVGVQTGAGTIRATRVWC